MTSTNKAAVPPLNPPPEICGRMSRWSPHLRARSLWIGSLAPHWSANAIGRALGISACQVLEIRPDRARKTPQSLGSIKMPVTLPDVPVAIPGAWPEVGRRGLCSAPKGPSSIPDVIAAIRDEHRRIMSEGEAA